MRKSVPIFALTAGTTCAVNPAVAQSDVLLADDPLGAVINVAGWLMGQAGMITAGLGLLLAMVCLVRLNRGRRAKTPDALAVHSLVAMSQVAIAGGRINDAGVKQIAHILSRLMRKAYTSQHVMEMLQRLSPSAADLAQVGQNLSEKDRRIVLEAALNIAVADGEIHPNEYAVVSELAQRLRIGSDQFRHTLKRISAQFQDAEPV